MGKAGGTWGGCVFLFGDDVGSSWFLSVFIVAYDDESVSGVGGFEVGRQ
jgi:hypothetical protein